MTNWRKLEQCPDPVGTARCAVRAAFSGATARIKSFEMRMLPKLEVRALCLAAALCLMNTPLFAAETSLTNFITAHDGKLFDGDKEFRFISLNIPNLLEIEDNVAFTNENPWRLPDAFEINDALETIHEIGGTVTRTYTITVQRTNDLPGTPRHVLGPGKFNEDAFRAMDQVFATANRTGVRLIIPLLDNWPWMGG